MSLPRGVGAVGGEEATLSSRVPIAAGISVDLRIIAARHVDVGVPAQRRHVAANFTAPNAPHSRARWSTWRRSRRSWST